MDEGDNDDIVMRGQQCHHCCCCCMLPLSHCWTCEDKGKGKGKEIDRPQMMTMISRGRG